MVGAIGWIGGVVNALPEAHVKLYQLTAVKKNYPAAQEQVRITRRPSNAFEVAPRKRILEGH